MNKERIWELDALRGLCILAMVVVHFVYNMPMLYGVTDWILPQWFRWLMKWGALFFLLLSGICVTLGSHPVRRGLIVLGCGMVYTAVTAGMHLLGLAGKGFIVWFGVLHCLGVCMLLWPLLRRLSPVFLGVLGLGLILSELALQDVRVNFPWLVPLGIVPRGFSTPDYFPLIPNLGWFLVGSLLGKTLYKEKKTLLPGSFGKSGVVRAFGWCGRMSLFIYMLHQPILAGIGELCRLFLQKSA